MVKEPGKRGALCKEMMRRAVRENLQAEISNLLFFPSPLLGTHAGSTLDACHVVVGDAVKGGGRSTPTTRHSCPIPNPKIGSDRWEGRERRGQDNQLAQSASQAAQVDKPPRGQQPLPPQILVTRGDLHVQVKYRCGIYAHTDAPIACVPQ